MTRCRWIEPGPAPVSLDPALEREFEERVADSSTLAFRVALGVLRHREDAEDVAQDAFLRAHRAFALAAGPGPVPGLAGADGLPARPRPAARREAAGAAGGRGGDRGAGPDGVGRGRGGAGGAAGAGGRRRSTRSPRSCGS